MSANAPPTHERALADRSPWSPARREELGDGRRPDWGSLAVDLSTLPPAIMEVLRRGTEMQMRWLETMLTRTWEWYAKFPK